MRPKDVGQQCASVKTHIEWLKPTELLRIIAIDPAANFLRGFPSGTLNTDSSLS